MAVKQAVAPPRPALPAIPRPEADPRYRESEDRYRKIRAKLAVIGADIAKAREAYEADKARRDAERQKRVTDGILEGRRLSEMKGPLRHVEMAEEETLLKGELGQARHAIDERLDELSRETFAAHRVFWCDMIRRQFALVAEAAEVCGLQTAFFDSFAAELNTAAVPELRGNMQIAEWQTANETIRMALRLLKAEAEAGGITL